MTELGLPAIAEHLRPLLGRWVGEGQGLWVAAQPLRYSEEVDFVASGKAFLTYHQRTQALDDGRALHTETGYLRATGGSGVEMLIVQPTGFTEIHTGALIDDVLDLELVDLGRTSTALGVTQIWRQLVVGSDTLDYQLRLAMNDEPLADHLRGHLLRQP